MRRRACSELICAYEHEDFRCGGLISFRGSRSGNSGGSWLQKN
jgi:hypothetical protein